MRAVRRFALLLSASPLALALPPAVHADIPPALPGHFSLQGFGGSDQGGSFSAWLPIIQSPGSVGWASPYAVFGNGYTSAGFGLGYRSVVSPGWVIGGYAYVDGTGVGTENWLWQGTVGAEAISNAFEARANVYLPFGGDTIVPGFDVPDAVLNADNMLELSRRHRLGATGVDGEVGVRLLQWGAPNSRDGLRAFAGAYSAWRDETSTSGFSGRLEARFSKPDTGLSFTLSGGASVDRDGHSQFAIAGGFSMPLGGGASSGGGGSDGMSMPPLDIDPVHHLGAVTVTRQQYDPAYFLNGRPTGAVQYADGVANTGNDGLTAATATALGTAVTRTGEDGIIVAVGGNGDLVTAGQTLQDGQAVIGGGKYLPLMAADGTTGFSWQAGGGSAGTIAHTGSGYALTLADYNTIIGVGVTSTMTTGLVDSVIVGGINGQNSTGAYIFANTVGVTVTGIGDAGDDDDQSAAPHAEATGGAGGTGIANSGIYGINVDFAQDADVSINDVTLTVTGTGGVGGSAVAGDGGGGDGTGGTATGGAGGRGISLTDIVGISAKATQASYVSGNSIGMTITGNGGNGGMATGGDAVGGLPSSAGDAVAGAGGSGVEGANIWGIYANGSSDLSVVGNTLNLLLTANGGNGNSATGGNSDTTVSVSASGGSGNGGAGGTGVRNTDFVGIAADNVSGDLDIVGNHVTLVATATGGNGGDGTGGDGVNTVETSTGGTGNGGNGGTGADTLIVYGITAQMAAAVNLVSNDTTVSVDATGGNGGDASGGDGGDSSNGNGGDGGGANGGNGGAGLISSTVVGESVYHASGALQIVDDVTVSAMGVGGNGGMALTGSGGAGANYGGFIATGAIGGDGGDGVRQTTITGIDAAYTTASIVTDLHVSVDGNAGDGGAGTGGDAGTGSVQTGTASAANFGGKGGDGLDTNTFRGVNLANAVDATIIASSLTLNVTGDAGAGADGSGGKGADGPTQTNTSSARGGDGTGGSSGAGITGGSYVAIDATSSSGSETFAVGFDFNVTANGATGGRGFGGDGGNASDDQGGFGGDATSGDGGAASTGATYALLDGSNSSDFNAFADHGDLTIDATAGDAGTVLPGKGGNGNTDGGTGGKGTAGKGGEVNVTATAINLQGSSDANVSAENFAVTLTATAGNGADASGGAGGAPNGLGGNAYGGSGGDVTATVAGLDLRNATGMASATSSTYEVTLTATAGDGGDGFAGTGGLSGGTDGHGEGAVGGSVIPVVYGATLANAADVSLVGNDLTVTFHGTGGDSGDASGNSTVTYTDGGTGDTTPTGVVPIDTTGVGTLDMHDNNVTLTSVSGNGAGGVSLP